jgi:hypothetical protein
MSNKMEVAFQEFLATQSSTVSLVTFCASLLLTAFLCFLLAEVFARFGSSFSNRRQFGGNFVLIGVTTMIVITVVKSSLALSLGLVGALSIVRFRTPIKDPEELAFLFITISIGLGLGANQVSVTLIGFSVLTGILIVRGISRRTEESRNLLLTVSSDDPQKLELPRLIDVLSKYCTMTNLRRFDESQGEVEVTFMVDFRRAEDLLSVKNELMAIGGESTRITFLDNQGIQL